MNQHKIIETRLDGYLLRSCSYCELVKGMCHKAEFESGLQEYFCSKQCRDKYFEQYEKKVVV